LLGLAIKVSESAKARLRAPWCVVSWTTRLTAMLDPLSMTTVLFPVMLV